MTRFISFWSGLFYVSSYIIAIFEWYDQLYLISDKSNYDFVTIAINAVIGYNMILHSEVAVVCLFIILKEISMEFFHFLGKQEDDTGFNLSDFEIFWKDLLFWINPLSFIDIIWNSLFGKNIEDMLGISGNN